MPRVKPNITKYKASYELIYPWVAPDPKITTNAICTWCKTIINVSSMGKCALQSHAKSQKHTSIAANKEKSIAIEMFMQHKEAHNKSVAKNSFTAGCTESLQGPHDSVDPVSATANVGEIVATSTSTSTVLSLQKKSLQSFLLSDDVTRAEIRWCIQSVISHIPIRTAASCISTFSIMFSDSKIAKKMQLGRTKISYSIVFGIAPYFRRELLNLIDGCNNIVLEFDESLNSVSQKAQMDLYVRFWNKSESVVSTRFFDSVFLQRTRAIDLRKALIESFGSQNLKKILHLSMDGPNVNIKVFNDLNQELKESFDTTLLNIGSCGLHVLHGAFKTGMQKSEWKIVAFLRALYYLFKDTPTRRAQYTEYTESTVFPKKFCAIRWIENVGIANRAIEMLPHLRKYVAQSTKEKTAPNSQSFQTVSDAVNDKFLDLKLTFFSATASKLEPFLREFQTDAPMAPFLYNDLNTIIYFLMQQVIKSEILNGASNLIKVNLSDKNNLISAKCFELDFATKDALKKVKDISDLEILQIKNNMRKCIIRIIEKLFEKSPLKYKLTQAITCLDPKVALDPNIAHKRVTSCLEILVSSRTISGSKADKVKQEYINLCSEPSVLNVFKSFKRSETRLDTLWTDVFKLSSKPCDNLVDFVQLILILSHGNASVERGFSVNAECLVENQHEKSLVAQRMIYDSVKYLGNVENLKIEKRLIHSMRNAHSQYKEFMEKQRTETEKHSKTELLKRRKLLEIKELEAKKTKYLAEVMKITTEIDNSIADLKK